MKDTFLFLSIMLNHDVYTHIQAIVLNTYIYVYTDTQTQTRKQHLTMN